MERNIHTNTNKNTGIIEVVSNKRKLKLPKSLMIYLMAIQFCYGFNMGVGKERTRRKTKTFLKIFQFITFTFMFAVLLSPIEKSYKEVWFWGGILKYIASNVVLHFSKCKPYLFLNDIHGFGENISAIDSSCFGVLIIVYTFGIALIKSVSALIRCHDLTNRYCFDISNLHRVFYNYSLQGSDSIGSILIVLVYYVYCYVDHIRQSLISEMDLTKFEQRYVATASLCDKIRKLYERIVLIELFTNTPRLMVTLWYMLLYIKENAKWYLYTSEWFFAFHLSLQIFIPTVIAEMVNCQMDSIKLILNEQCRIEKDKEKIEEIARILRYIEARRLQKDIWRVIPVDLRLPLGLISLCTTYFIIILQFTHLYD